LRTCTYKNVVLTLGLVTAILTPQLALSTGLSGGDTVCVVPYEDGGTDRIPSAAASIMLVGARSTYDGALFNFEIEVFDTAWEPVYSIEITVIGRTSLTAVDWPHGWTAETFPKTLDPNSCGISFRTETDPIAPGRKLGGFSLKCDSQAALIRWHPASSSGELLGKTTRTALLCPTAAEPLTWGGLKAVFR
jgi:hypothetical protein